MVPGCAGNVVTIVVKVLATLFPHALFAVTEITPPALPGITVIEFDVDVPLQPDGNVQV